MPVMDEGAEMQAPSLWMIVGDKAGDNGQVQTIVDALGWPCQRKYVHMREQYVLGKPRPRATLEHLDLARSDPLVPPWPDVIITVGRRPSMVARWVRQQAGGRTRIVMIGKPSCSMRNFDLVIASAENQLPPLPNYLPITLPLMRVPHAAVEAEAAAWADRLAGMKRPLTAVLVGGQTNPFVMNAKVGRQLAETIRDTIERIGGSAWVTTSRRTTPEVVAALREGLPAGAVLYEWGQGGDNPYRALLGSADGFIVTGDSISMMVEVIGMHQPLAIFPLPSGFWGGLDQLRRSFSRWLFNPRRQNSLDRWRHRLGILVFHLDVFKILSSTRDFRHFHQQLVDRGLAVWAGQPFKPGGELPPEDISRVVARIHALVEKGPA